MTTEPIEAHELPDRLPRSSGVVKLQRSIIEFEHAAAEYDAGDKTSPAPVHNLAGEASIGKTQAVADHIRTRLLKDAAEIHEVDTPTIELGEEFAKSARERGIRNVVVVRGRGQQRPDGSGMPMCMRHAEAEKISKLGMSVKDSLCHAVDEKTGEKLECPFAKSCPYLKQREEIKKGGLIVRAHQYLTLPDEDMPKPTRRYIDESFWAITPAMRNIDLGGFLQLRSVGERFYQRRKEDDERFAERRMEETWELEQAILFVRSKVQLAQDERRNLRIEDFRSTEHQEGLTPELCRHLATLEYSRYDRPVIKPNMDSDTINSRIDSATISQAIGYARFWLNMAEELSRGREGEIETILIKRGANENEGAKLHLYWKRDIKNLRVPTLVMDADADREINARVLPFEHFAEIKVQWRNIRIVQAFNKVGTGMTMSRESNQNDAVNTALHLAALSKDQIGNDKGLWPLLVAQKSVIEAITRSGVGDDPVHFQNYGNIRGKDEYKNAVGMVIAGRREPTVEQVENIARCLNIGSSHKIQFLRPTKLDNGTFALIFPKKKVLVTPKEGEPHVIEVSYHPDPLCDAILRQIRDAELMQAIARVRPVHRSAENPCTVVVLTNVPLSVQVDELALWEHIVPDAATLMRLNGVQFRNMEDASDAHPTLMPSGAAGRKALSRRREQNRALAKCDMADIYNYISQVTLTAGWADLTYRRGEGRRGRSVRVEVPDGRGVDFAISKVQSLLPDAHSFELIAHAPAAEKISQEVTETGVDRQAHTRLLGQFAGLLKELSAEEQNIIFFQDDRKRYFDGLKTNNAPIPTHITSVFEAFG
ncbi:hypothetical protein [Ensifer aridi]|uniref:hypothetical protein n=1 Tax=Ensifer aridi TaxID=1708715 RepID=UPI0015E3B712|nr:hypothetical protein [Ensifer aridi]